MKLDQDKIDSLIRLYKERRNAIRSRLGDFKQIPESIYFYELAYCLLTPQSSAVHADRVIAILQSRDFLNVGFDPESILRTKEHYIRFHRNKSKYLLQIRTELDPVLAELAGGDSSSVMREWLVNNVKGLGFKEATHFLRNIGKNDGLAILDRHILRNLRRYGAIRTIPTSLSKKRYLAIEKRFKKFADLVGIPLDELDLLFWSMETGEIRK